VCGGPELEDGTVAGADMMGDQLRDLVDPSGTLLHGCVWYQEEALLRAAAGAAEALSDVHSRVFESSDLEAGTVTGVDMVDNQLRGSVDPSGTPLYGCVEYQEGAVLAAATWVVEAFPGMDSQVFEGSDLEVGTVTGIDMVNNQLRGSMDPLGTPLHGCVKYQEEALLSANLPGASASGCSGQVHHDHDAWPGRMLKNKRQTTRRLERIQWLLAQETKYRNTAALSSETKVAVIQETTTNEANVIVTRANKAKIDNVRMDQTGIIVCCGF